MPQMYTDGRWELVEMILAILLPAAPALCQQIKFSLFRPHPTLENVEESPCH